MGNLRGYQPEDPEDKTGFLCTYRENFYPLGQSSHDMLRRKVLRVGRRSAGSASTPRRIMKGTKQEA